MDVKVPWKLGEKEVTFLVKVPKKNVKLAARVADEIRTNFLTALKAYSYKIIKQTCEE